jgi:hypothetical protein
VSLYEILGAIALVVGSHWALLKVAVSQFERRLDERFAAQEKAREEGQKSWQERVNRMESRQEEIEKDVRRILIELPREYVNRTDYVRRETVIEAKIDQLSLRIQNWILGGGNAQ